MFEGIEMVWIPPGEFMMGSDLTAGELARRCARKDDTYCHVLEEWFEGEQPRHKVTLTEGFWLGKYEVTNGQYRAFLGATGYDGSSDADDGYLKHFRGKSRQPTQDDHPIVCVSWKNAKAFCNWLSEHAGRPFGLPTEAQWEYACRAATTTPFHFGETISREQANCFGDDAYGNTRRGVYRRKTARIGSFAANAWGLHDMHGNVSEWCADWKDCDYYGKSPSQNPTGPSSGETRVLRGGSLIDSPGLCRSAMRNGIHPSYANYNIGFRVCCVVSSGGAHIAELGKDRHQRNDETRVPDSECQRLIDAYTKTMRARGSMPEEFRKGEACNPHSLRAFDVNRFLDVFDRVALRPGFTLDYVYAYTYHGGQPLLYARQTHSRPIASPVEYYRTFALEPGSGGGEPTPSDTEPYARALEFEETTEGFFHFALFCMLSRRFYLWWHSNYNNRHYFLQENDFARFVNDRAGDISDSDAEDLADVGAHLQISPLREPDFARFVNERAGGISDGDAEKLAGLDISPRVRRRGHSGEVTVACFDLNIGYSLLQIAVEWPNHFRGRRDDVIVKSNIRFFY